MSDYLPCVELDVENATHSIIWLHGLGADGHDFEPIVNELELEKAIRFIFPHAPSMPVTINNGMTMPAWYDIKLPQIDQQQDEQGIHRSQQSLLALIDREIDRGIPSENIIIAGFSQGGAVALHTALRYENKLAGIMGLSTYLPLSNSAESEIHSANKLTPIFLAHGLQDPVIAFSLAEQTKSQLDELGYAVDLHSYVMEHSVCVEEVNKISDWINNIC